jgi:hypothetical protein
LLPWHPHVFDQTSSDHEETNVRQKC